MLLSLDHTRCQKIYRGIPPFAIEFANNVIIKLQIEVLIKKKNKY